MAISNPRSGSLRIIFRRYRYWWTRNGCLFRGSANKKKYIAIVKECYSYVTIYDDRDLTGRPVAVLCDPMSGRTIEVDSSKITVSLFPSYTGSPPGQGPTDYTIFIIPIVLGLWLWVKIIMSKDQENWNCKSLQSSSIWKGLDTLRLI